MKKAYIIFAFTMLLLLAGCSALKMNQTTNDEPINEEDFTMKYTMPAEDLPHEGTWLTWPHPFTYGEEYKNEIENIWLEMTSALSPHEKVHIIAYDTKEKSRIESLLLSHDIDMKQIDFVIAQSDDVWARDTGPIFLFDENKKPFIANFRFDGWGEKVEFKNDDQIPSKVGAQKNIPVLDIPDFVIEGGSIEMDGSGTLMASLSSVVSENRNQNLTKQQAEGYLSRYFGATNFIWLNGVLNEDITDAHIDGIARFAGENTILTVSKADFAQLYEGIDMNDYSILQNAKNAKGNAYKIKEIPLTKSNVKGLDYKGSYLNYYIANSIILAPIYNDENDDIALEILTELYPEREIIPIDVSSLFQYGGMLHCVTQQQPISEG